MLFRNMFLKYMSPAGADGDASGSGQQEGASQEQQQQSEPGDKDKPDNKPTDREAELLREVMSKKAKIQELEDKHKDVDVDLYKTMLAERAERDQEAQRLEQERLKAEGKFDELLAAQKRQSDSAIAQVKSQYEQELTGKIGELSTLQQQLAAQQQLIESLTINNSFANSQFIRDELVPAFSPTRTQKLYGEHFDVIEGKITPFDKPRGDKDRTVMVDKNGAPLAFEEAIARLVDADPDAAAMKRSKHKNGAASGTSGQPAQQKPATVAPGVGRIQAALNAQAKG